MNGGLINHAPEEESVVVKALKEAAKLAYEAELSGKPYLVEIDATEKRWLKMISGFCDSCVSLSDCPLPTKGWIPVPPDQGEYLPWSYRKCANLKVAEQSIAYKQSVESKWNSRSLDSFQSTPENTAALEVCRAYADRLTPKTKHGLYIHGGVGTGKTHLAIGIIKAAFQHGLYGAVVNVPKLLNTIKDSFKDRAIVAQDEVYAKKRFIVLLDDLGAEKTSDWACETLYDIINTRYESNMPTLITSNCSPSEMTSRIGLRTADRLREMCSIVTVGGQSWRGEKRLAEEIQC
jgi:DNA replication protein DnaC